MPMIRRSIFLLGLAVVFLAGLSIGGTTRWLAAQRGVETALNSISTKLFPPGSEEPDYEEKRFEAHIPDFPPIPSLPPAEIRARIAEALGFDSFQGARVGIVEDARGPSLPTGFALLKVEFESPSVGVKAIFSDSDRHNGKLFVVLHGFQSSSEAVLRLRSDDYMNVIGHTLRDKGDVLVPELISSPGTAASVNQRLLLLGGQWLGLEATAVCALLEERQAAQSYQETVVYGMRMGALVAEFVGHHCPGRVSRIVMDGFPLDLKQNLAIQAMRSRLDIPMVFQFRGPLLSEVSALERLGALTMPAELLVDKTDHALAREWSRAGAAALQNGPSLRVFRRKRDEPFAETEATLDAVVNGTGHMEIKLR